MRRNLLDRFLSDIRQVGLSVDERIEDTLNRARGARAKVTREIERLDAAERAQEIERVVRAADPEGGRVLAFPVRPAGDAAAAPGGKR